MEKRIHLYVSRKHPALWLAGLLMLASVVARIAVFSQVEGVEIWWQMVWPSAAVILFLLMAYGGGEEMLHRTAIPVWMLGICEMWQLYFVLAGRPLLFVLGCIGILFFCDENCHLANSKIYATIAKKWKGTALWRRSGNGKI